MKVINPQIQEQGNPRKTNTKKIAPRHITIKWLKISDKKKILKAFREKGHFTHEGIKISKNYCRFLIRNHTNQKKMK